MKKDHKVWLFVAAVVVLIILLFLRRRGSGSTDTAGELTILRDKIKNMETYKTREGYTSPNDNNGLTIAGTILEQFLDVSIEVFNQPLVKEMLDKVIKDSGDARVLATVIEDIGGAIRGAIKKNDLLQCLTKLDCRKKTIESGEGVNKKELVYTECRIGDTDDFARLGSKNDGNEDTVDWRVSDSRWHSSDTKNCHRYKPKDESFMKIAQEVTNKISEMLMDPAKQKLYYDTFVQIGKDNTDFIISHNAYQNSYSKGDDYINPFSEGGEFKKQFPREHAFRQMTNLGQGIKSGTSYRVLTASQTMRKGDARERDEE
jgi:hypothetical protein